MLKNVLISIDTSSSIKTSKSRTLSQARAYSWWDVSSHARINIRIVERPDKGSHFTFQIQLISWVASITHHDVGLQRANKPRGLGRSVPQRTEVQRQCVGYPTVGVPTDSKRWRNPQNYSAISYNEAIKSLREY
jgi:hypothetical protein